MGYRMGYRNRDQTYTAWSSVSYATCHGEIGDYICVQEAKGLVEIPSGMSDSPCYRTHWGTHEAVILPEVKRIIARYGCQLVDVKATLRLPGRGSEEMTSIDPDRLAADDWVYVVLLIGD